MSSRYTTHLRPVMPVQTGVMVPLDVRLMHMAASLMFVGVIVGALMAGVFALVRLPMFALTGITVQGDVEHNNAVTLRANVVGHMSGNFFTIDLGQVRSAFESVPWVRQAAVQREFPNRLRVTLQEHQPVAFWGDAGDGGDVRMVDSFGEVFEISADELEGIQLPRLIGPDSQSQQVLAMYEALSPKFKALTLPLNGLELTGRGSWRARLSQGAVIELGRGSVEEVLPRLQRLSDTLEPITQRMGRKISALMSVDLRYDNGYALRLRGVSTLEPSAKKQTPTN